MTRPTVHDIARSAGVSLATVDRVLNERPGVRTQTVDKVNRAVAELGYVRDVAAANLARQRSYRLAFILPDVRTGAIDLLHEAIAEAKLHSAAERTILHVDSVALDDPHGLAAKLRQLEDADVDGVAVMAPETPQLRNAVRRLKQRGKIVVAIVSDLPDSPRDEFAGIDNIAAGRTAGVLLGRFNRAEGSKILVLAGSLSIRDHAERRQGFDEVMTHRFPGFAIMDTLECWDDAEQAEALVSRALLSTPDISGIYSLGAGNRGLIRALKRHSGSRRIVVVAHELVPYSRRALEEGVFDAVIAQNFGHIVRSAIRMLRARADGIAVIPSQERIGIDIFLKENLDETSIQAMPGKPGGEEKP